MQQIQRPWSTKDYDLGIKAVMHFAGKDDVDEITVRSPEDLILNAKSNVSPSTYVYKCSVPSKWLGHKVYTRSLEGDLQARGVGIVPSVDIARRSELTNEVVIDMLMINLSD